MEQGTVVLTGGDAGNYELVWTDGVGSITPAALTVRVNDDAKFVTRGDVPGYAGVSYSGFVNGETVGVVDQSGLTIVRTNTGTEQAGVYADVLAASGLSAANYEVLYEAGDYTIVAADALWLQLSGGDQVYGDAAVYGLQRASYLDSGSNEVVDLTGSATLTGDVVSVDDGSGGVVTVSLEALSSSQSGAGERPVGVYGVQAGTVTGESSNFGGQVTVTGTLTVRPRMLTAAVTGGREKVYDGTDVLLGLTLSSGDALAGDAVTVSGSGRYATKDVSTGKSYTVNGLQLTGGDAGNYTALSPLTGTDGVVTVRSVSLLGLADVTKVYDATVGMPLGEAGYGALTGVIGGDDVRASGRAVYGDANVGEGIAVLQGTVSLTGGDAGNYTLVWTDGAGSITPAVLDVRVNSASKLVTQADPSGYGGVSITGYAGTDDGSVVDQSGLTIVRTNSGTEQAGEYAGVLAASGLSAQNYGFAYEAGDFTIVGAGGLRIALEPVTVVYGDSPSYTVVSAAYVDSSGSAIVDLTEQTTVEGRTVRVDDGASGQVEVDLLVSGAQYSGSSRLQSGSYDVKAGVVRENTPNVDGASVTVSGSLVVDRRSVTGAVTAGLTKEYDGLRAMEGVAVSLTPAVYTGDAVTVTAGAGVYADKNAGSGKAYEVTGTVLGGSDAGNYVLTGAIGGSDGEVTPRSLQLVITPQAKVYDGTTDVVTTVSDDRVGGDALTAQYDAAFAGAAAGTDVPVVVSGLSLTGADAGNYTASDSSGTADITARALTITANTGQGKERLSADPVLTFRVVPELVADDSVSGSLSREPGETPGSYAIGQGTLTAGSNYAESYTGALFTIVDTTPAVLTLETPDGGNEDVDFAFDADSASGTLDITLAEGSEFVADLGADEAVTWGVSGTDAGLVTVDDGGSLSFDAPAVPGTYVVVVTATDASGNVSVVTVTIEVRDDTPPVVDAQADDTVETGEDPVTGRLVVTVRIADDRTDVVLLTA
ncbi:MAG: hypothetical protein EBR93_03725, partial [Bacteroidetes bacterium]|nr:hypothetical protein [Bacteroidota bacterium]